jgi:MFS family permease
VLLLLLLVAAIFAAVFLLLPFVSIRKVWTAFPRKPRSALYFTALGLGFMFFEITLIQRLVLFLGYPTYSLTVTLASILIFTGVGALLTGRYGHRPGRVVPFLLAALAALTVFYQFGLPPLTDALLGWPLAGRVVTAFVMLAPLGICLGAFMPLGLGAVSRLTEYSRQYVAWGWAVNGFASVVGAVLTTILAMTFGFRVVLFLAIAAYVVAVLALRGLLRDTRDVSPVPSEVTVPVEPEEAAVPTPSPAGS